MQRFKIGLAQISPRLGNRESNLARHLEWIEQAKTEGVDLLIFPELGLSGYYLKDLTADCAARPQPDDPLLGPLLAASAAGPDLVVSYPEEDPRYTYHISASYLSQGRVLHTHRKVYLPTYALFDDARFFGPGETLRAFDTPYGRLAILICEDAWHVSLAYLAWLDGADLFVVASAAPGRGVSGHQGSLGSQQAWHDLLRVYANFFTIYVAYCNRVGVEDGVTFAGGSTLFGPTGRPIGQSPLLEEHLLVAEIDPASLRRARRRSPLLRDEKIDLTRRELERIYHQRLVL